MQSSTLTQRSCRTAFTSRVNARRVMVCRAQQSPAVSEVAKRAAAAGAAALLTLAPAVPALANEFDILAEPAPTNAYYVDDAGVLSKSTKSEVNKRLRLLETTTGYRVTAVTVRKLEFETDAYAFADKALENWYGSETDKKGVVLMVTTGKEGAVTGGASFLDAVGEELLDSIASENIPVFAEEEKFNAAITSSLERVDAKLNGNTVPEAPKRNDAVRQRTYKTKAETEKSKTVTSTVVLTLLVIACVVPMLQYYGYTARD
ncbi:hypothetical protein MNEG_4860 [Monoraphidium neglectum]|uniref:TPM domain-containing protein n=1 Tax=Monoraphidium neglectum TaxID=145388 RepID=A0A0D2JWN2_9CHLO|nr:hypothetical protein MNEG_4860 [Monoraphidium neglectum]KIZ03098.1 hypothetical protein MNEG_4860 [Monoraphidium neglectum]|eukprot:XP_013902117.1 hypothetical protein MNEG_4860 [Monoraphidium neglectum]